MLGLNFSKAILKGFSRVMLQGNAITGLLFLIGIAYSSWLMAASALIGVVASTLTAHILRYPKKDIEGGFYGFNGVLVGIALTFFFSFNALLIAPIVAASALSSIIMRFMMAKKIPPLTFPFVAATWIFYFIISPNSIAVKNSIGTAPLVSLNVLNASSHGLSQVMFQENAITGIIFLAAILISSRISAVYALIGTLLGFATATALGSDTSMINAGIFGFNAVLCSIAFAKTGLKSVLSALLAIVLSVFIALWLLQFNLPMLTFPFVLATWLTLLTGKVLTNFKNQPKANSHT